MYACAGPSPAGTLGGNISRFQILMRKMVEIQAVKEILSDSKQSFKCGCSTNKCTALLFSLLAYLKPLFETFLVPSASVSTDVTFWALKTMYFICSLQGQARAACPAPDGLKPFWIGGTMNLPFEYYLKVIVDGASQPVPTYIENEQPSKPKKDLITIPEKPNPRERSATTVPQPFIR